MAGAVLVAIVASIGNLLQGWDNATIAGIFLICLYLSFQNLFYKRISFSLPYPFCSSLLENLNQVLKWDYLGTNLM